MAVISEWLDDPTHWALSLSLLFGVAALVLCLLLRKLIVGRPGDAREKRSFYVGLVVGVLVLFAMSLCHVWRQHVGVLYNIDAWLQAHGVYGGVAITLAAMIVIHLLSKAAEHAVLKGSDVVETRHKLRRGILWAKTAVLLILLVFIWLPFTKDVGVFLGIVGAGVAFALQEPLLCMTGWALILLRKPFDVGDRIEIDNKIGDVIDIGVFQTTLVEVGNWVKADQSTGRLAVIPNSQVFRAECFNYTKGFPFIWNELRTVVTFESDWRKAKEIVLKQAQEEVGKIEEEVRGQIAAMQKQYAIRQGHLTPIVYTDIADVGVALTLRYLSPVRQRRETTQRICEGILSDFAKEPSIDFAYPTTRFYDNAREGKPGTQRSEQGGRGEGL